MNIPYDLWREITVTVGAILALLGFFRGQEQHKDSDFQELGMRLANSESAMIRATAATQLPAYFNYRRYLIFRRPYRKQALSFALNGLKVSGEKKFVRQALVDALNDMLQRRRRRRLFRRKPPALNLIDAHLDQLILFNFVFDGANLTQATLKHSDLGNASFVNAKLWRADLSHAKLTEADLTDAKIWDADFSHANLENAVIRTQHVNAQTRFDNANLKGAALSRAVVEQCNISNLEGVTVAT